MRLLSGPQPPRLHGDLPSDAQGGIPASAWSRPACASKRLSEDDIQAYIGSGEWRGKAGGYAVQGIRGLVRGQRWVGSYSNVVGLPLYESVTLMGGEGLPDPLRPG